MAVLPLSMPVNINTVTGLLALCVAADVGFVSAATQKTEHEAAVPIAKMDGSTNLSLTRNITHDRCGTFVAF